MPTRFHLAIRLLHWAMAVLIIAMLFIGVGMVSTAGPAYPQLLALHRPIGIAILLLASARLMIRFATRIPPLPRDLPRLQALMAKASHLLLYAAMLGMPLIGWAMLSAGGYPAMVGGGISLPPIMPQNGRLFGLLRETHRVVALAFFLLVLGHLTIALVHGFIRRDGVLSSMGFGERRVPPDIGSPRERPKEQEAAAPTGSGAEPGLAADEA